jgi:hypothetical protein
MNSRPGCRPVGDPGALEHHVDRAPSRGLWHPGRRRLAAPRSWALGGGLWHPGRRPLQHPPSWAPGAGCGIPVVVRSQYLGEKLRAGAGRHPVSTSCRAPTRHPSAGPSPGAATVQLLAMPGSRVCLVERCQGRERTRPSGRRGLQPSNGAAPAPVEGRQGPGRAHCDLLNGTAPTLQNGAAPAPCRAMAGSPGARRPFERPYWTDAGPRRSRRFSGRGRSPRSS